MKTVLALGLAVGVWLFSSPSYADAVRLDCTYGSSRVSLSLDDSAQKAYALTNGAWGPLDVNTMSPFLFDVQTHATGRTEGEGATEFKIDRASGSINVWRRWLARDGSTGERSLGSGTCQRVSNSTQF